MSETDADIDGDREIDNSGVHPAIGVVLMVIFTVIISAVIGTVMLSLGETANGAMGVISLYT